MNFTSKILLQSLPYVGVLPQHTTRCHNAEDNGFNLQIFTTVKTSNLAIKWKIML